MPGPNTIQGDLRVTGNISGGSVSIPPGNIGDPQIAAGAPGQYVQGSKVQHQKNGFYSQGFVAAVADQRAIYRTFGATGTVLAIWVGSIAPATGNATCTVDIRKNNVSMLTAPVVLNNANVARVAVAGNLIAGIGTVANDEFEIIVTVAAGTGVLPFGVFAQIITQEDPA